MEQIYLPILDWFVGDPAHKNGNSYAGSIGFHSIQSNAFCYKAWLERNDNGVFLMAEVYDILTKTIDEKHTAESFPGNQAGWEQMQAWIGAQYQLYLDQGRNQLTVSFVNKED